MSAQPDVIVVGSGIIGLFTAWELRQAGLSVAVLERGSGREAASWAGGGILSPLHPWRYPEPVLALARWSQGRYPTIAEGLARSTGIDPEWTQSGLLALEPESVTPARVWARRARAAFEVLGREELARRFPGVAAPEAAVYLPEVAQVRNPRLLKALDAQLRRDGVEMRFNEPVQSVLFDGARAIGVQTGGETLHSRYTVVCAGAWSGKLLPAGIHPQPVKGEMLLYAPGAVQLPAIVLRDNCYLVPRRDGRVLVGSTVDEAGFDTRPTDAARAELKAAAEALVPDLRGAEIEQQWAGLRPGTRQPWPWIGACPDTQGLFVNTGHFRHGLTTAPASARILVDRLLGRPEDPVLAEIPIPA